MELWILIKMSQKSKRKSSKKKKQKVLLQHRARYDSAHTFVLHEAGKPANKYCRSVFALKRTLIEMCQLLYNITFFGEGVHKHYSQILIKCHIR